MKNSFFFLLLFPSLFAVAQIQQYINKNTGTVSNSIPSIDSIRFTGSSSTMEVVLQNGTVASHSISDIINVNFAFASMHSCGADSILNPDLSYGSMSDQEGNQYKTIVIGSQEWMAENLKTSIYRNGAPIPNYTSIAEWQSTFTSHVGAWTFFQNDSLYECPYGKVYNWYAVSDPRQVCPTGWHVPTIDEWTMLTDYLGGSAVAGGKMKSTGLQYWRTPNLDASNESGFSGIPGGYVYGLVFNPYSYNAMFWSATEFDPYFAWHFALNFDYGSAFPNNGDKADAYGVRCVRD